MKTRLVTVLLALLWPLLPARAAEGVALLRVSGAISPATAGYIERGIKLAAAESQQCVIIQLDTPGGLLESTKDIVQAFYKSRVPVVVYVGPEGATATSAGCFITMAADVAAMSPDTTIGAAHPVSAGGEQPDEVMKEKMENFAATYIEAIAEKHGRNADWAKAAVRESASLTAAQAKASNVIDLIAVDVPDLLKQMDGRKVRGTALKTAGVPIREIAMTGRERVFQMVWRPEVMMLLMLVAIYGIIGEISNPGTILPGVVGVIALVLVLYMSSVLPIQVAGVVLIVLALGLFLTEAILGATGWLTAGGVISFFVGLLMLFDRDDPVFRLSLKYIIPATIATAAFFVWIVAAGLRAQRMPVKAGRETLLGKVTPALTPITAQDGKVFVEGEYWNAVSDSPIPEGTAVEIVGIQGLTLKVQPKSGKGML